MCPAIVCMLLGACDGGTTTIIREVPAGSAGTATADGSPAPQTLDGGSPSAGGSAPASAAPLLADPMAGTTVGTAGQPVDCAGALPCRWVSADAAVGITIGSVDHLGAAEALTVDFSVDATRDTAFAFVGAADVAGAGGPARAVRVSLGAGNGVAPQAVTAGSAMSGRVTYDASAGQPVLAEWAVTLDEAGAALPASFLNLPVAAPVGADVDCAAQLPCTWRSNDGSISLTLTRAGGFSTARRLDVGFLIDSTSARSIAMDAGSTATAREGFQYSSRTHRLDGSSGFGPVTHALQPGQSLVGSVDFYRSDVTTQLLSEVRLEVFEDAPVPRWRPGFLNVPSTAP